jgi:Tol biopolymer transport system component
MTRLIVISVLVSLTVLASARVGLDARQDQQPADQPAVRDGGNEWDTTLARGTTREIDFTTSEGTWMSVDLSPDGQWIVFDLLGHIYRVRAAGGEAECLTASSGVAINMHPRWSPDARAIAFISDRKGQTNLWLMDADGGNPRAVFLNKDIRSSEPSWSPDGRFILVRRSDTRPGDGGTAPGIWMHSRDGGEGVELIGRDVRGASWPSPSADGRYLYFQMTTTPPATWSGRADVMQGGRQIRRLDLRTGQIVEITSGESVQQGQSSSGGGVAPEISPDGRWLAFARRIPDGTISHEGLKFGPRTALWIRDLETGAERLLMDPIEVDMAEGMKVSRDLPGYGWARDGKSLVVAQGGRIRRVALESGQVSTIPFSARVRRTISEMAGKPFDLSSPTFTVKFPRWTTSSPDGRRLAFQAAGRIYVMDLPSGTPRRLTTDAFEPFEMSPAWSPDSTWIAFASWADQDLGHLWKIPAEGGTPVRLTQTAGEFLNTIWSPDGRTIAATRGSGATAHGRTVASNLFYSFVRVPAEGGPATVITTVNRPFMAGRPLMPRRPIVQAFFGPDGRLFYPETFGPRRNESDDYTEIASIALDGTDRRVHLVLDDADEAAVSPDGRWLAFQEGDNVYVTPFPMMGTGGTAVRIDKRRGRLPVVQVSTEGGMFPRWRNETTLEFSSGPRYYAWDVNTKKVTETPLRLALPRAVAKGSVAFTGARLLTMEGARVIERGTVVIIDGRVACVGQCTTAGLDRVIDVKGKTIMPGLIDMHAHHHRDHEGVLPKKNWESAIYMAYGVTTTLDNSMWSGHVFPQGELIEAGAVIGPRTYTTGDPLYSGDGARQNEITSYEVAEQNIARLQAWGAVTLKQYMQPRRDQRQWISDIARKRGLRVTAEGGELEYNVGMIMDGQTGWEHPMPYMPLYADAAQFFGKANATYSVTFLVGGAGPWNEEFFYQDSEVWRDEKLRRFTPWRMLIPGTRRRMLRPATDYSFPLLARGLRDIVSHGGYGAIGSHGQQHGLGSHWEIWAAAAGMGNQDALAVATLHGARFLGLERELGSLTTGKLGDLIVLNSNPLDNIRNTADIKYVVKNGTVWDAATLDEVWPRQVPFGEYYWVNPDALKSDDRPTDWHEKNSPSKTQSPTKTGPGR